MKDGMVQCVSNGCGYYKSLKVGKWYKFREVSDLVGPPGLEGQYLIYFDDYVSGPKGSQMLRCSYPKKLFRTFSDRRDFKLKKIGVI